MFVGTCAWLAAAYLTLDARHRGEPLLVSYFSRRARIAGIVTGLFAVATLAELHSSATRIFDRLTTSPALPLVVVSALAVAVSFVLLITGSARTIRPAAAAAVATMIWAWGIAQYPYLLPDSLTVRAGSSPEASLVSILAGFGIVAILVAPSFVLLFVLRGREKLSEEDERDVTEADLPGLRPWISRSPKEKVPASASSSRDEKRSAPARWRWPSSPSWPASASAAAAERHRSASDGNRVPYGSRQSPPRWHRTS